MQAEGHACHACRTSLRGQHTGRVYDVWSWVNAAGCAGLHPTVAAIKAGKDICLANKETLIAGGPYVLPLAREHGVNILPADSEHSVSPLHPLDFCSNKLARSA